MFIHEMTQPECRSALAHASVGRLACAHGGQPYVVPIYFGYDGRYIYGFSTLGQKIEWMRSNPLVCLEIDERSSHDEWMSVIVFGRYEELPQLPENQFALAQALQLFQKRSAWWWEPACVSPSHRDISQSSTPIAYRIHIDRMSGHHATPDNVQTKETHVEAPTVRKRSWLANIFGVGKDVQKQGRDMQ
jgi:uncharacterized protein